MTNLTITSYAILGQLALRSWTAYELTVEMRRNLHYFWPRAESGIYAEVKRLTKLKLIHAEQSYVGKRPRTIYSITAEGREALREWFSTPPSGVSLEFEGLLRVFLSPFGTLEQLLATLNSVQADADELLKLGTGVGQEYLEGHAPFQKQVEVRALVYDFLINYAVCIREWAMRTKTEVESWDQLSAKERRERGLRLIESDMKKFGLPSNSQSSDTK